MDKKSIESEVNQDPLKIFDNHLSLEKDGGINPSSETIVNAMNDFSKQKSVAFSEWISSTYIYSGKSRGWREWNFTDWAAGGNVYKTTSELYDLFLKQ